MSTSTLRQAVVRKPSGPGSILVVERPVPSLGPTQVLLEIAAAAVNPVDVGVASGRFHALGLVQQAETGLGWDFAGTVSGAGAAVEFEYGARVAGFIDGFDRDHGSHATHLVVDASVLARVPDGLDLSVAAAVPLNAVAAAQLVDLVGDPPRADARLLVTGAAGAVGSNAMVLACERGWNVTGLARPSDEGFVRRMGADFTVQPPVGWDAVADAAAMQGSALELVRDGGRFVGMQPASPPTPERGISVDVVVARPDAALLDALLSQVASGILPGRVHSEVPLEQVQNAYRVAAGSGVRGKVIIRP